MLLVLLLELGDILVHGDKVIQHLPEALGVVRSLRTSSGAELGLALVSDHTMAPPGASPHLVERLFEEYVALVRSHGLLGFFEPAAKHVTLSTQAGVRMPDRRLFELALMRLGYKPDPATAMFITEEASNVAAGRALGMTAWQYGVDFDDWSQAPILVSGALALAAGPARGRALESPAAREARYYQSLEDNAAIAPADAPMPPGTTHSPEPGPDGKTLPKRRRYSIK